MIRKATRALVALSIVLAAVVPCGAATERVEKTLSLEQALADGQALRIENLVGSIEVVGGGQPGRARVAARVIAEAPTKEQAEALADGITLIQETEDGAALVRVRFPVDRHALYRMPRSEDASKIANWFRPIFKRDRVVVPWRGTPVEVGSSRDATALAVQLEVVVPNEVDGSFAQAVGTIRAARLRGRVVLENLDGGVVAEQVYGRLRAQSALGNAAVRSFQGDDVSVETTSGDIEVVDVRSQTGRLRSGSGAIRGRLITIAEATVETGGGKAELVGIEPATLRLRTESGSADISTHLVSTRSIEIETVSGDVWLRVGPNSRFSMAASSGGGSVETKGVAGLKVLREEKNSAEYARGSGGAEVSVASTSGDVNLVAFKGP